MGKYWWLWLLTTWVKKLQECISLIHSCNHSSAPDLGSKLYKDSRVSFINHWPARSYVHSLIQLIYFFHLPYVFVHVYVSPVASLSLCLWLSLSFSIPSFSALWWRHQMEALLCHWPFVRGIHRWPVDSPHKCQWRGALLFSMMCAWTNGWANNRDAGDLGCHIAHCDVTVMSSYCSNTFAICTCKDHSLEDLFQKFWGQYIWPMPNRIA